MKTLMFIIGISLLVAGFSVYYFQQQSDLLVTTEYPEPRELPAFEMKNHNGQPFTNQQLKNKWSILFFGFTYCPDICPTALTALAKVANKLNPETLAQTQFVFISVDPERDTLEILAEYMVFFHPDFIGIRGEVEQLNKLAMGIGAMYIKVPSGDSYTISHSGSMFVINPQGRRHGVIIQNTNTIDTTAIAADLNTIIGSP